MISKAPLPALTGIRAIGAVQVVLYHALRPKLVDADDVLSRFLAGSAPWVTLFFVLSGFVLTYVHDVDASKASFFRARFARIAPVYFLALFLAVPIGVLARLKGVVVDPVGPLSLVLVTFGVQSWVPDAALRWNPPAWSLSCEIFFYALFPFVLPVFLRMRRRFAVLLVVLAWAAATATVVVAVLVDPTLEHARITDDNTVQNFLKLSPLMRFPEFLMGMLAGRLWNEGVRVPAWAASVSAVVVVVVAASGELPYLVLHNGLLAPLFAVLTMSLASGQSRMARVLSWRPLVVVGDATYGIYLFHVPLLLWTAGLMGTHSLEPVPALFAGFMSIPLALVVMIYVERPFRRMMRGAPAPPTSP